MWLTLLLTLVATLVASLPLFVSRRASLLNPAAYTFLIVAASLFLKAVYIATLHPHPRGEYDKIFIGATSPDFLVAGALLGLVAMVAYTGAYFAVGRHSFRLGTAAWESQASRGWSRTALLAMTLLVIVCFILFLRLSHTEFFHWPFSAKRFLPHHIGTSSRFLYPPYYLFKLSSLSGSAAVVAALLLFHAKKKQDVQAFRWWFAVLYLFALMLAHFASLRLFILIVLAETLLVAVYTGQKRHFRFVGVFVLLTAASFAVITFVHRVPPPGWVPHREEAVADDAHPDATALSGQPASGQSRGTVPPIAGQAGEAAPPEAEPAAARPPSALAVRLRRLADAAFDGRYFMDLAKLAHLARHFPAEHPWLGGRSLVGVAVGPGGRAQSLSSYVGQAVFREPDNNVPPGYAGELYTGFGWAGLFVGFLALGALHRLVFNYLASPDLPFVVQGLLIVSLPSTTVVLLNSGLVPAASRCLIDFAIILIACPPAAILARLRR